MFEPTHFNVRADECSTAVIERGHRVVLHRGERYIMVGFYFARGHDRQRELYYILCPPNGDSATGASDVCRRRNH